VRLRKGTYLRTAKGTRSFAPSMEHAHFPLRASQARTPWQQRTDAAGYHPAGLVRAFGNCARNRVTVQTKSGLAPVHLG